MTYPRLRDDRTAFLAVIVILVVVVVVAVVGIAFIVGIPLGRAGTCTVRGTVVGGASSRMLGGVTVTVQGHGSYLTGSQGAYSVSWSCLGPSPVIVSADASKSQCGVGSATVTAAVSPDAPTEVDLKIPGC